jgi:zinc D-Ala-D-Ala dipeptidase
MKKISLSFWILLLLFANGCEAPKDTKNDENDTPDKDVLTKETTDSLKADTLKPSPKVLENNLVDVQLVNPKIIVELKYATTDNFMGKKLYSRLNRAYLQKDVAERLSRAQEMLDSLKPGYRLLVYDAVRPVSVQQKMWDALDSIPPTERGKFVSNPKNRSLHNMGAAVDLTIVDLNGKPLDMGAGYDDIRKIAYPSLEEQYLKSGELTQEQVNNRILLRKVMEAQRFRTLPTEWWHFNACSRPEALVKYKVLMEEP